MVALPLENAISNGVLLLPLALIVAALLVFLYVQARQHSKQIKLLMDRAELERNGLLNRIQAPELAALPENPESAPYVAPDDDKGYWAAQEEREGIAS